MKQMTPRARVLASLNHQEADRLPLALGGGPYGLVDEVYLKLVSQLNIGKPVLPFRQGHSISYMDDRLLDFLGTDLRYVWPGASPSSPTIPGKKSDTFLDSFGQTWKRATPYYYVESNLLRNSDNPADIDRLINWPNADNPLWTNGIRQRAKSLAEDSDYFIVMRMVTSHGPYQTACDFRGTENFLMDMATNPSYAKALLARITDMLSGLTKRALEAGGRYFDMIELPGDDYAGNTNLVFSPSMFREFIKPCISRLVNVIREFRPDIKIMLHSDGAITPLLDDLIDLGIDVIHPLEPLPSMDLSTIKARYGDQLTFLGGIDISHALTGSRDDVVAEVKRRISQLASGGGYILAPANHIQADVPPENVIALYQAAREYGRYTE